MCSTLRKFSANSPQMWNKHHRDRQICASNKYTKNAYLIKLFHPTNAEIITVISGNKQITL